MVKQSIPIIILATLIFTTYAEFSVVGELLLKNKTHRALLPHFAEEKVVEIRDNGFSVFDLSGPQISSKEYSIDNLFNLENFKSAGMDKDGYILVISGDSLYQFHEDRHYKVDSVYKKESLDIAHMRPSMKFNKFEFRMLTVHDSTQVREWDYFYEEPIVHNVNKVAYDSSKIMVVRYIADGTRIAIIYANRTVEIFERSEIDDTYKSELWDSDNDPIQNIVACDEDDLVGAIFKNSIDFYNSKGDRVNSRITRIKIEEGYGDIVHATNPIGTKVVMVFTRKTVLFYYYNELKTFDLINKGDIPAHSDLVWEDYIPGTDIFYASSITGEHINYKFFKSDFKDKRLCHKTCRDTCIKNFSPCSKVGEVYWTFLIIVGGAFLLALIYLGCMLKRRFNEDENEDFSVSTRPTMKHSGTQGHNVSIGDSFSASFISNN